MRKLLLCCLVLAACDAATVEPRRAGDVYDYRLPGADSLTMRWPTGSTVRVYVAPDADASVTTWLQRSVDHAVVAWGAAALYGEVRLAQTSNLADADAVVVYSTTPAPVNTDACKANGALAFTTFCLTEDGEHLAIFPALSGGSGRVKLLVTIRAQATATEESVRRLVTHELGHVLGIGQHSAVTTDLMFAGAPTRDTPSARDRATLEVLYHTAPDVVP